MDRTGGFLLGRLWYGEPVMERYRGFRTRKVRFVVDGHGVPGMVRLEGNGARRTGFGSKGK